MGLEKVDELERIYNLKSFDAGSPNYKIPYQRIIDEEEMNFKFKIGDKVQHTAFGYNAVVMRRIYTEDADSNYNAYDIAIWESTPPIEGQCIAEIYLKTGHRVE